jgi:hypothetical protein
MSSLMPWLSVLAIAAGAFLVGKYFQREERKQRELRKQQAANLASSAVGAHSAAQAMHPTQTPEGLGSVQGQTHGQRFPN